MLKLLHVNLLHGKSTTVYHGKNTVYRGKITRCGFTIASYRCVASHRLQHTRCMAKLAVFEGLILIILMCH